MIAGITEKQALLRAHARLIQSAVREQMAPAGNCEAAEWDEAAAACIWELASTRQFAEFAARMIQQPASDGEQKEDTAG